MTESFLHYVWQFQYFDKAELLTTAGEAVTVFHPGQRNTNAGPDFFNARMRIGSIEWVGSVEIHIQASGWIEHGHNSDPAYENVILHVVWNDDKVVNRSDNSLMPTITLKSRIGERLLLEYRRLAHNPEPIPCASAIGQVNNIIKLSMLDKALMERLEIKSSLIIRLLQRNNSDWEETCFQAVLRNFGFKVNADPFMQLSQSISYKFLLKHANSFSQVEALLFGQAGFLEDQHDDPYYKMLQREYSVLGQKYRIHSKRISKVQWRFLRLRPANFPTIRIAQFASLIYHRKNFFSSIVAQDSSNALKQFFTIRQSDYWMHHYHFAKEIRDETPVLGENSIDNIIINSVVPLLVAYGKSRDDSVYLDRAVRILQHVHAESNMITRQWKLLGMPARNSFDSQALVQLYNHYCQRRKCLDCNIGASIVNPRNA